MSYTEGNLTETQNDLSEQNNRKKKPKRDRRRCTPVLLHSTFVVVGRNNDLRLALDGFSCFGDTRLIRFGH